MMIDNTLVEELIDKELIKSTLHRYAQACDKRDWELFKGVFSSQVEVQYGEEFTLSGLDNVVSMVKSMLGGCGPTQHLIGNIEINIDGDNATATSYLRASHTSAVDPDSPPFEIWAENVDMLQRRPGDRWVIMYRRMKIIKELGSRDILTTQKRANLN